MADKKTGDPEEFHVQHDEGSPMRPVPQGTAKDVREQHEKETLEFERIQAELEEYGEIMQSCIEEAERTIQIWRGTPEMTRQDTEIFLAMMPAVSVALFEMVTGKVDLENNVKVLVMQSVIRLAESILKEKMQKIIEGRVSDSKDEEAGSNG